MDLEDPITDLSIAMKSITSSSIGQNISSPIIVKIPGRELALAKRGGGGEPAAFKFIAIVQDHGPAKG